MTRVDPTSVTTFRATLAECFRYEVDAVDKHEFRDGIVVELAGATRNHSLITVNVGSEIGSRIKGTTCRVHASCLRYRLGGGDWYVYADASVICGVAEEDPADPYRHTVTNPKVIVEVLSPSTEAYDRGEKFQRYIRIDSLEEYVLVSQSAPVIQTITRQADGSWAIRTYEGMDAVARIRSLEIDLPLAEAFAGVEFPAADPELNP